MKGAAPKPGRLGCKYGLPSISHNDSAYKDQVYWRGRTWGPSSQTPVFRVSTCAARTLNPTDQSRVSLSPR